MWVIRKWGGGFSSCSAEPITLSTGSVFLIPHRLSIWSYCCFPQSETLPSHFLLLHINRTGILGFADMCSGAIVFLNSCMSLPAPTPHFTTECSFLPQPDCLRGSSITIRNGPGLHHIPQQHPGGTADSWSQSKMHVVKIIWKKAQAYGVFASSWVKHRWMFECCNLGQWMSKIWVWSKSVLWYRYKNGG